jgi:MYXO-CTERM domain-containing protein
MKHLLRNSLIALSAACVLPAAAETITLWDFNSSTLSPSIGAGTAGYVGGTVYDSFSSGSSTDPAPTNVGWNTKSYPTQGTANKTAGVQFNVDTTGFTDISISFDTRHSGTASKFERFQYSINGTDFIDLGATSGVFSSANTSFATRSVDLTGIGGAENNPNFAFRIVAEFESTATGAGADAYLPTSSANYGTTGTWRFDMVGVSGTSVSPVPEPTTAMLGLVGAGALALRARRRN